MNQTPRIAYVAYPTSLNLRSANAIQTHTTLRELQKLAPSSLAIIPRWLNEPSRFAEVGALHLPRPAIGKLSRLHKSTLWYYAERSAFAAMTAAVVAWEGLRGRPFDVVYVREVLCAGWWAALWGPLLGIPVIYEAHDLESWNPSRAKERWVQPLLHLLDRLAIGKSTAVASLTDDFRQLLARLGWRSPADVAVIPDAFDSALIMPGERSAARQALNLPANAPLLVYAGMTFSYRGLDRLLAAFPAIQQRVPGTRLAFVGGRPQEIASLQQVAAQHGISEDIAWLGQLPQPAIAQWLAAADVLVIPDTVTDVTASPLKLFEYLAAERAVVLPDIPALAEILPPDVGYVFRRGDTTALAQAAADALTDTRRAERASRGRALVTDHTYASRARRILTLATDVVREYGTIETSEGQRSGTEAR